MKKLSLILLLILCLSLTSCSKDAQANAFMKEYASVTAQITEKLEEGDVDEAREIFESRKDVLNAKWDAVKRAMSFQISKETKKRMNTEPEKNITALTEAAGKAIEKHPNDRKKVEALVFDLANVVRR
jgi:hypothetical protein